MPDYKVVFNSSPIINLYKIDKLDLIRQLYGTVYIPFAVFEEIVLSSFEDQANKIKSLVDSGVIKVMNVSNPLLTKTLADKLDKGESEAIVLALEMKADLLILDETEARKFADLYEISKTGFIGILLSAYKKDLVNDVFALIQKAIDYGFWINPVLINELKKTLLNYKKNK